MPDRTSGPQDSATLLRSVAEQAVLAPSSHNTQPWVFRIDGDRLELYADCTRALPVNDPRDRELTISCAAAPLNARVAIDHADAKLKVVPLPDGDGSDLLATATIARGGVADEALFAAIADHRTYRKDVADRHVPPRVLTRWPQRQPRRARTSRSPGPMRARDLSRSSRKATADSSPTRVGAANWRPGCTRDAAAGAWPSATWRHPRRASSSPTSISASGSRAGTPRSQSAHRCWRCSLPQATRRRLDGRRAGATTRPAYRDRDGPARPHINQPVQVDDLRPRVAELLDSHGFAQLTLRLGYPSDDLPAAPRRPVDAVIEGPQP